MYWSFFETLSVLNSLADYRTAMEAQLIIVQETEFKNLDGPEYRSKVVGLFGDDVMDFQWAYEFMFPRYLRYSFVVLLFLVLENHLSQMCDTLKQKYDAPIRMNDLKGDTIARCRAYLDKIIGLPNLDDQIWGKLEDLSKIRNCIVHALGKVELSNDQKRLKDLATQGYGLSISDDEEMESGILTISTEFCATAVGDVREFFVRIFKAIEPESFDTIR